MKESYIKKLYSDRIGAVRDKKGEKTGTLQETLDFSVELPDAMPDFLIIDTLYREASKWENRGSGTAGDDDFNISASRFMTEFFGTPRLDPETEICVTGEITSALNLLAMAFINRGDFSLITKPSASQLENMTKWLGGSVIDVPLSQKNKFFPKYEEIPQKNLKKAKLLYINYPGNPTGQTATAEFFKETVDFAKTNELIVLHDASYSALIHEEGTQLSFLSAPGANKVGIELHSLSYGFNMAGWGIGFIAGNKNVIRAFREIADRSEFGLYAPIKRAASYALTRRDIPLGTAKRYERRLSMIADVLTKLGFKAKKPKAGFYIYVKYPKGTACGQKFQSPREFGRFLAALGIKIKTFDEGYARFSATFPALGEEEERKVAESLYERLKDYAFIF